MRLGFHYHVPAVQRGNGIFMPGFLGRFIDSLAVHCECVVCFLHSPRSDESEMMDYRISASNVSLVCIGPHASVMTRQLKAGAYTSALRKHCSSLDVLLVRGASPLLPAMAAASPVPTALLLVSDYVAGVNDLPQPRWRKEAIRLWSYWNKWGQQRAVQHSLTFVNSRALYNELRGKAPYLEETRTTTLSQKDFFFREDTCQRRPIRLLFSGRISVSKGLLDIVDAFGQLLESGEDLILDLVGWSEKGEQGILQDLFAHAQGHGFRDRIFYHGYKGVGPELFAFYRQADIFVLASRSSFEGFPRAIWEAMAHSLPVVATRVGSIPLLVEGSAELVRPGNVPELTDAIRRLTHESDVRQEYIRRGLVLATENTLEIQVGKMAAAIRRWLDGSHD